MLGASAVIGVAVSKNFERGNPGRSEETSTDAMRGFFKIAKAAAEGAAAGARAGEAEVDAIGPALASSLSLESESDSEEEDEDEDEADPERLRFLTSGAGLGEADDCEMVPPFISFSLLSRANRLPNSPPPDPPPVTPSRGVALPLPAATNPAFALLVPDPTALAPEAGATPMARREPATCAPVPRFMPIPRVSSLASGIAAIFRAEKTEPPLAMMAACDSALPRVGFESGFHPIEASKRKPGADVSAGAGRSRNIVMSEEGSGHRSKADMRGERRRRCG